MIKKKPTIAELEAILDDPSITEIRILPNGEVQGCSKDDKIKGFESENAALKKRVVELEEKLDRADEYLEIQEVGISKLESDNVALKKEIERLKAKFGKDKDGEFVYNDPDMIMEIKNQRAKLTEKDKEIERLGSLNWSLMSSLEPHGVVIPKNSGEKWLKTYEDKLKQIKVLRETLKKADHFLNDMLARHDGTHNDEEFFKVGSAVHQALKDIGQ